MVVAVLKVKPLSLKFSDQDVVCLSMCLAKIPVLRGRLSATNALPVSAFAQLIALLPRNRKTGKLINYCRRHFLIILS